MRRGAVVAGALLAAACASASLEEQACAELLTITDEAVDGVLTDDELRDRLRAVYDTTREAEDLTLRRHVASALESVTSGQNVGQASRNLADACAPYL